MNYIKQYPLASFVLLVVCTPYVTLGLLLLAGVEQSTLQPLKLAFALTPLVYVCGVVHCVRGDDGVRALFSKLWNPAVLPRWYFASILIFVSLAIGALVARFFVDGFFPPLRDFASLQRIVLLAPLLLLFPGITEEFAWRGFLQSRLQSRMHWWWASLLVGLVWGSWHGFDFLLGNWTFSWSTFWSYPLYIISNSIIIGWIFERTGESVFLAMLAHFGSNFVNFFIPVFEEYHGSALPACLYIGGLCAVALLLPVFARRRRPGVLE